MIRKIIGITAFIILSIVVSFPLCLAQNLGVQVTPDQIVVVKPLNNAMRSSVEPAWGTDSTIIKTVQVLDFLPDADVEWVTLANPSVGIAVYQTAPTVIRAWWAPVSIPSGATVTAIELEACDSTATGNMQFGMASGASPGGSAANVTPVGDTGLSDTPGCAYFSVAPYSQLTVNNFNNKYWLFLGWSGDYTSSNTALAIRVWYNLQMSPDPVFATFSDVPVSHWAHQYVEALYASGITEGYSDGTFRPGQPVLRGQMAAFLSKALGLHWPY
jgi:hypothetical protein